MSMTARFTLTYSLTVLAISGLLVAWAAWLLTHGAGWDLRAGAITVTENALKLALLAILIAGVLLTQFWDLIRPRDILIITSQGVHDRRLTQGTVLWEQVAQVHIYRKGWQYMLLIIPKALTTQPSAMKLGGMPLYAFNRLCARWLNRPELTVGLGGMTVATHDILAAVRTHYSGPITQE